MDFDIKFQKSDKTQFMDLEKAKINESGQIVLSDGRCYKVEIKTAEGEIFNKGAGNKELAEKTLHLLRNTSQRFETFEQLTINDHSATHFARGKETVFKGDEKWKDSASKLLGSFTKNFSENISNEQKVEKREIEHPQIEPKSPGQKEHAQQVARKEISETLKTQNSGGPQKLSNLLMKNFSDIPSIQQEMDKFKRDNAKKIAVLNDAGGWLKLKGEMKARMTDPKEDPDGKGMSYEQFRKELNTLVTKLVNQANEKMGIPYIKAGGAGTPGYNSDIDLNMKPLSPEKPLSTGDWVVSRAVANLFSVQILGNMPGPTIDTEWYVDRKFLGDQAKSENAKAQIATLDLAMGIIQAKEGFKSDPKEFEAFKQDQIKNSPKQMIEVKKQLFEQAEKFYEKMELDIAEEFLSQKGEQNLEKRDASDILQKLNSYKEQASFEKDYYNAKVLVQYRAHISLGSQCAELEKLIEQGKEKLKNLSPYSSEAKTIERNLDEWIVKHDVLYAMINCTQAEGTMSSSELQTTLDSSAGQIRQRFVEDRQKELAEGLGELGGLETANRSRKGSLSKLLQGAHILEKVETKTQTEGLGKELTIPTLLLAGQERLAQFSHKIREHGDPIDAGKYCLRVAESNYFSLKLLKAQGGKKVPKDIDKQIETAGKHYTQARHLEQCKRGFNLNGVVAREMLEEQIKVIKQDRAINLSGIEKIFNKDEIGGDWFEGKNKTLMTKELKLEEMVQNLENKKYISATQKNILLSAAQPEKPAAMEQRVFDALLNVRAILQAKAGFDATLPESGKLRELHNKAKEMTKQHYGLTNPQKVSVFAENVENYTLSVQKAMSKAGAMPKFSEKFSKQFQFAKLWKM